MSWIKATESRATHTQAVYTYRRPRWTSGCAGREQTGLNSDHYRKLLLDLKREVSNRIDDIDRDIRHEGMSADWSEQASERENDEVLESLGNSSEAELAMIKHALLRLDAGHYFQCDECGAAIPEARLDLLPFTIHCVDCAEKLES